MKWRLNDSQDETVRQHDTVEGWNKSELRKTKRWLNEWLRAHPVDDEGLAFYTPVGRDKVFLPSDITRIEAALREELQCRSISGRRASVKRRTTKSVERISESEWKRAAELLNDPSLIASATKRS
jgi:hypothetical protein